MFDQVDRLPASNGRRDMTAAIYTDGADVSDGRALARRLEGCRC